MIRRLFTLCVFSLTVTLASFGQQVFGREHLIVLAHRVQAEGPARARTAWHETDKMLAHLVPQAGSEDPYCTPESLSWAIRLYQ